jgi:hypothetical protein
VAARGDLVFVRNRIGLDLLLPEAMRQDGYTMITVIFETGLVAERLWILFVEVLLELCWGLVLELRILWVALQMLFFWLVVGLDLSMI